MNFPGLLKFCSHYPRRTDFLDTFHLFPLHPQVRYSCIRKEDISGIASCVFTKNGQGEETCSYWVFLMFRSRSEFCSVHVGFYLISPSEYERFSLSAKVLTAPLCSVQLDRLLEAR